MQLDSLLGKRYAQIGKIATVETHKRASLQSAQINSREAQTCVSLNRPRQGLTRLPRKGKNGWPRDARLCVSITAQNNSKDAPLSVSITAPTGTPRPG